MTATIIIKKFWKVTPPVEGVENLENSYTAGGNVKWYSHCVKQFDYINKCIHNAMLKEWQVGSLFHHTLQATVQMDPVAGQE